MQNKYYLHFTIVSQTSHYMLSDWLSSCFIRLWPIRILTALQYMAANITLQSENYVYQNIECVICDHILFNKANVENHIKSEHYMIYT